MKEYLIIGASGLVGYHLQRAVKGIGKSATGTCYQNRHSDLVVIDIRNYADLVSLLEQIRPDVVCLPASLTDVDYCETHPDEGYEVNVAGVKNTVQASNQTGSKLVYFSSDYIFDGRNGPYREEDTANPICEYGRQKLMAEHYIALNAGDYLIVRTTVVYGWEPQGKNFVHRLVKTLRAGDTLRVPEDQVGSPTYAPDLARAVIELLEMKKSGVYHVVGSQRASRYAFALEAAITFGLDEELIEPVRTDEMGQAASRPLEAGMVTGKVHEALGRQLIGYQRGLEIMAAESDQ